MSTATYREFAGSAATKYEEFFVPTIATPFSVGLLRAAALQPGESVLDVACGTGLIARLAAGAVGAAGSITAVDLAPDMIEVAAATEQPDGAEIEWHQADAVSLPFPDKSFDVVLCQMGLMFIEDKAGAVEEMHRVLRPRGRVIINTPGTMQTLFENLEASLIDHINPELSGFVRAVFSMHDPTALGRLLADADFVEIETTQYLAQLDLPTPTEFLWQYINLTPMAPLVAQAPETAKAAMEAQFVESCAALVVDGRVPLAQPAVLAAARRP
ncbi:MAG: methyltransferase domain-containing protein [Acidimicrobiia bacterium]|nr:methyltransferase domain-containing protein [Acidimicrobiia bacterium]